MNVAWSNENKPQAMLLNVIGQQPEELTRNQLVQGSWRWAHQNLSIDKFSPRGFRQVHEIFDGLSWADPVPEDHTDILTR
jgi:hypothetical protein